MFNCLIRLINSHNLVNFEFQNPKFNLKDNFINNPTKLECSQICQFLLKYLVMKPFPYFCSFRPS